jgi:hypothetical protein
MCTRGTHKQNARGRVTIWILHFETCTSATLMEEMRRSFARCFEFLMIYLLTWSRYQRKGGGMTGRLIKFAMQERLVSSLELKVLGALYVLGTGASQDQVGIQTHLSEEVHRVFFSLWLSRMSLISSEYIYMPTTEVQFEFVVGEVSFYCLRSNLLFPQVHSVRFCRTSRFQKW